MSCPNCGMETCVTCRACGGYGDTPDGGFCRTCHALGCVPHGLPTRWYTSETVALIKERARTYGYSGESVGDLALFFRAEDELIREGKIRPL